MLKLKLKLIKLGTEFAGIKLECDKLIYEKISLFGVDYRKSLEFKKIKFIRKIAFVKFKIVIFVLKFI